MREDSSGVLREEMALLSTASVPFWHYEIFSFFVAKENAQVSYAGIRNTKQKALFFVCCQSVDGDTSCFQENV